MRARLRHQPVRLRLPDVRRPAPTHRRVDVSRLPLDRVALADSGTRRETILRLQRQLGNGAVRALLGGVAGPMQHGHAWPGESRPPVATVHRSSRWLALASSMRTAPICRPFGSMPTPRRTSSRGPSTPARSPVRRTSSSAEAPTRRRRPTALTRWRTRWPMSSSSHGAQWRVSTPVACVSVNRPITTRWRPRRPPTTPCEAAALTARHGQAPSIAVRPRVAARQEKKRPGSGRRASPRSRRSNAWPSIPRAGW